MKNSSDLLKDQMTEESASQNSTELKTLKMKNKR